VRTLGDAAGEDLDGELALEVGRCDAARARRFGAKISRSKINPA